MNEFHVKELDLAEFDALLRQRFRHVEYFGQRIVAGSTILAAAGKHLSYLAVTDGDKGIEERAARLPDIVYFIAVCSQRRQALGGAILSIALSEVEDPIRRQREIARWAQSLEAELRQARQAHEHLAGEHEKTAAWARSLEAELSAAQCELESCGQRIEALSGQLSLC